jgi:hypothetical protein
VSLAQVAFYSVALTGQEIKQPKNNRQDDKQEKPSNDQFTVVAQ